MFSTQTSPLQTRSGLRFELASPRHDAQIRSLLRDNPMPGPIALSMEREPGYFAGAAIDGGEHHTIVAIENDRVICVGSITTRRRFINGVAARVGYLGGLRLDRSARGRAAILRGGYQAFQDLRGQPDKEADAKAAGPPIYFSSIVSSNETARRFLERGLPGMPAYRRIADFVTLALPCRGYRHARADVHLQPAVPADMEAVSEFLNRHNRQFQLAPVWTALEIGACRALSAGDFHVARDGSGRLVACAALWDQRAFRQVVVRGYAPLLRQVRPIANLVAGVLGTPSLPAIGQAINLAFASHLATASPELLVPVLRSLQVAVAAQGAEYLTVGFDSRDPRLQIVRRHFKAREYASRLYAVFWEDGTSNAQDFGDALFAPDVALL
jgi:hypothetical protein